MKEIVDFNIEDSSNIDLMCAVDIEPLDLSLIPLVEGD